MATGASEQDRSYDWNKMCSAPCVQGSNLTKIDETHFIIAGRTGIHSYNTLQNIWYKLCDTPNPTNWKTWNRCKIAYDASLHKIWILGNDLSVYDMQSKILIKYPIPLRWRFLTNSSLICINSELHIFDGQFHQIMMMDKDSKPNIIKCIDSFMDNRTKMRAQAIDLIYVKHIQDTDKASVSELLLFDPQRSQRIRKYSFSTQEWTKLNIALSYMDSCCCLMSKEERYIIIMGGWYLRKVNEIFIFDINMMKIYLSDVQLPFIGDLKAVIMEYKYENDLLIHGFVKRETQKCDLRLALEVINLIKIWHTTEYVHVMNCTSGHWKINLNEIFHIL